MWILVVWTMYVSQPGQTDKLTVASPAYVVKVLFVTIGKGCGDIGDMLQHDWKQDREERS